MKKAKTKRIKLVLKDLPKGISLRNEITIECSQCQRKEKYYLPEMLETYDKKNVLYQIELAIYTAKAKIIKGKTVCSKCVEREKQAKEKKKERKE